MPEIISTPNALVQTNNGKRFYVFSGEIGADNTETTMIDINNIGERDIFISFEIGETSATNSDYDLRIKSNGVVVYGNLLRYDSNMGVFGYNEVRMILAANTSLIVTLKNVSSSASNNMIVACYGKYLSM